MSQYHDKICAAAAPWWELLGAPDEEFKSKVTSEVFSARITIVFYDNSTEFIFLCYPNPTRDYSIFH